MSSASIRIDQSLFDYAVAMAKVYHRSPPKQIEYWAHIGRTMEENPDLPFSFVQQALLSKAEMAAGPLQEYSFD